MKIIHMLLFATVLFLWSGCDGKPETEGIHEIALLKEMFEDPPPEYRSAPLWDWNDRISEEGIDFQMEEFKKAGIGGVFVHPRPGLITEYLSDEWFRLFDHAVQKGRELGMKVWIYDENSYPSGFAGGHVPAEMPDAYKHGTGLNMEVREQLNVSPSDTIEVVLKKTGTGFLDVTDSLEEEMGNRGSYYLFRRTYPGKSPWYGGFSYVDLLHEGVTEKFIEITMTRGYERNRGDFGKTLPGVFTDEPNLEAAMSGGAMMRWTPELWDAFRERWGYDLRLNLPSLAEETGNWKKIRHDYYQVLLELFVDRWAKPWSSYCSENGLKWTGHYWEHGWPEPTHGFDESAFYIWHQQPGVDMLGNRLVPGGLGGQFGNDRAVRELRSAANQAGKIRTLSETYGGGGWEMDFEKQKRLVDWQCVLGVNFVNQHLSYYTLKGVRKFDYPPSFSYHEPWWEHYRVMGDYIGRVCLAMASGQQTNETLVLQPNTTAWIYFSRLKENPVIDSIRNGFKTFVNQMEQNHFEYDLGSEYVLKTLGSVEKDKLMVGERSYSLVVIPATMDNINQSTVDLLRDFLASGGKILSFTPVIPLVDGDPSPEMNELAWMFSSQWILADNLMDPSAVKLLSGDDLILEDLTANGMLYHQRRVLDDGQLLFLVNSHQSESAVASVTMSGKYVTGFDLFTGEIQTCPARSGDGRVTFRVELDPVGSALFAVTSRKPDEPYKGTVTGRRIPVKRSGPADVRRQGDNVLVINYLDLKTAASHQQDIYFMDALNGLFRENGVEMGNPWQHKIQYKKNYLALDTLFGEDSGFEASYHFYISGELAPENLQSIHAVVERPELWQVNVNGQPVKRVPGSWWIDRDFPRYAIGAFLKPGRNTLTLQASRMHILAEIMPVYILGDFLVKPSRKGFEIAAGVIEGTGSWREAGLPFYPHQVTYSQTYSMDDPSGSPYAIRLGAWNGTVAEVSVNGKPAGIIFQKPYELVLPGTLNQGTNEISVSIYGSLKNSFGYFFRESDHWISGPHAWNEAPEGIPISSRYFLVDYGLIQPFELVRVE